MEPHKLGLIIHTDGYWGDIRLVTLDSASLNTSTLGLILDNITF